MLINLSQEGKELTSTASFSLQSIMKNSAITPGKKGKIRNGSTNEDKRLHEETANLELF